MLQALTGGYTATQPASVCTYACLQIVSGVSFSLLFCDFQCLLHTYIDLKLSLILIFIYFTLLAYTNKPIKSN